MSELKLVEDRDEVIQEEEEVLQEEVLPEADEEVLLEVKEEKAVEVGFHEMGLDQRILKAIAAQGWEKPTPIQMRAVPIALDGKDISSKARTGSGKTASYIIPIVHKILQLKNSNENSEQSISTLVLVPSRTLSAQACKMIEQITQFCSRLISCVDLSMHKDPKALKPLLSCKPDFVVGTPSRAYQHIISGTIKLTSSLKYLVIDEADLLFSYGYKDDMKKLIPLLSNTKQTFLMSATLSEETDELKDLLLHDPVVLNIDESRLALTDKLSQCHVYCEEESSKALLITSMFQLKLVRGKSILFVNSIEKCYRLRLFLEQFSIFSCVLNSELPLNSRCHVVDQFNRGEYNYIIATDESYILSTQESKKESEETTTDKKSKKKLKEEKQKLKKIKEYGVSRGIDFENVANVINYDFPTTLESYIHRVGRTARGDKTGTALSFVLPEENELFESVQLQLSGGKTDGEVALKPYHFKMDQVEKFKYRVTDAIRSVTRESVENARKKEIRREVLKSEKLKLYFQENPRDHQALRHDGLLSKEKKIQRHMKNVPDYLIPDSIKELYTGEKVIRQTQKAPSHNVKKRARRGNNLKRKKAQNNPLNSFAKAAKTS